MGSDIWEVVRAISHLILKSTDMEENELIVDDMARKAASKIVSGGELKIPLQKIQFYASYMQGMREAYMRLFPRLVELAKKSERPYLRAEYKLLSSCIDACYDYQQGTYEIHYRNHVRDKKGNLVSCEAYFVRRKNILEEVIYGK